MYRMCYIIYNGGQNTTRLDTWSIVRQWQANVQAIRQLKVIEMAEKCGNRAAGREYSVNENLVRDRRKKTAELEALPRGKRLLTILSW